MVAPSVFIPIAERFGLIGAIGNWVIEEACRQAGLWRDEGLRMRVAINLSAHQLRQADLVDRIDARARSAHASTRSCSPARSPSRWRWKTPRHASRRSRGSARSASHLSIDDFGTGYSSLATCASCRPSELKIDRSFVVDLEPAPTRARSSTRSIKLAHALGLKVVAEGVETEAPAARSCAPLGCDELQGFLFARPMSATALSAWAMDDDGPRGVDSATRSTGRRSPARCTRPRHASRPPRAAAGHGAWPFARATLFLQSAR